MFEAEKCVYKRQKSFRCEFVNLALQKQKDKRISLASYETENIEHYLKIEIV